MYKNEIGSYKQRHETLALDVIVFTLHYIIVITMETSHQRQASPEIDNENLKPSLNILVS